MERLCSDHRRPHWYCFLMRDIYGPSPTERLEHQRRFKERRLQLQAW